MMTWKEFKEWVEQQGVKDDDVIHCIDVQTNCDDVSIRREYEKPTEIWQEGVCIY